MKYLGIALTLSMAGSLCAPALAIDVLTACKIDKGDRTEVLLDMVCPRASACWPDPDDVYIEFVGHEGQTFAVDDMAWLDSKGKATAKPPSGYPARAIWSMPQGERLTARKARLFYDDEAITQSFELSDDCSEIPAAALKLLKIKLPLAKTPSR